MGKIKVTENCNGIEGLKVIEPAVFGDACSAGFIFRSIIRRTSWSVW